jgi:2-polyprenyl-6-methoxyphenol hydroxylase-like FAD-dependent oxidoreductase
LENRDPQKPETWKDDRDPQQITQPEMLTELKQMTAKIADPFKSGIQWIPDGTPVPLTRLYSWEPVPWDNHAGKIALAGDAAHTMTFRKADHKA